MPPSDRTIRNNIRKYTASECDAPQQSHKGDAKCVGCGHWKPKSSLNPPLCGHCHKVHHAVHSVLPQNKTETLDQNARRRRIKRKGLHPDGTPMASRMTRSGSAPQTGELGRGGQTRKPVNYAAPDLRATKGGNSDNRDRTAENKAYYTNVQKGRRTADQQQKQCYLADLRSRYGVHDVVRFYYSEEMANEEGSPQNAGCWQGYVIETKPKERLAKVKFTHGNDGEPYQYSEATEWRSYDLLELVHRASAAERNQRLRPAMLTYYPKGDSDRILGPSLPFLQHEACRGELHYEPLSDLACSKCGRRAEDGGKLYVRGDFAICRSCALRDDDGGSKAGRGQEEPTAPSYVKDADDDSMSEESHAEKRNRSRRRPELVICELKGQVKSLDAENAKLKRRLARYESDVLDLTVDDSDDEAPPRRSKLRKLHDKETTERVAQVKRERDDHESRGELLDSMVTPLEAQRRQLQEMVSAAAEALMERHVPTRMLGDAATPFYYSQNAWEDEQEVPWNAEADRPMSLAEGIVWVHDNAKPPRKRRR